MNCLNKITKTTFLLFLISFLFAPAVFAANLITNGSFDTNIATWNFYSDKLNLNTVSVTNGESIVTIGDASTQNTQLNQSGFSLKPNTLYTVKYTVKSNRDQVPLSVSVFKNTAPNTNFGYSNSINLSTTLTQYAETFTTTGFNTQTDDTRLMFYFVNSGLQNGDTITIDNVSIEEGDTTGDEPTSATTLKYDFNGDEKENILDLVDIIKYVFNGGA